MRNMGILNPGTSSGSGGLGGGAGSGGFPPNENFLSSSYMVQDTSRQILLILLRLQQDTNNVLTRLSYLEATVMSLQSNLQMNRIENSMQLGNQMPSAFSLVTPTTQNRPIDSIGNRRPNSLSFWRYFIQNVDWKTVAIAMIWPIIIRLVFFFLKKVKLVM
jgi:hypothetical protein